MNLKKLIVPVLCVLLGCAGGAAMGTVTAQTWPEPASVQRWQLECVSVDGATGRQMREFEDALLRERGAQGWRFSTLDPMDRLCFERPAP